MRRRTGKPTEKKIAKLVRQAQQRYYDKEIVRYDLAYSVFYILHGHSADVALDRVLELLEDADYHWDGKFWIKRLIEDYQNPNV